MSDTVATIRQGFARLGISDLLPDAEDDLRRFAETAFRAAGEAGGDLQRLAETLFRPGALAALAHRYGSESADTGIKASVSGFLGRISGIAPAGEDAGRSIAFDLLCGAGVLALAVGAVVALATAATLGELLIAALALALVLIYLKAGLAALRRAMDRLGAMLAQATGT